MLAVFLKRTVQLFHFFDFAIPLRIECAVASLKSVGSLHGIRYIASTLSLVESSFLAVKAFSALNGCLLMENAD